MIVTHSILSSPSLSRYLYGSTPGPRSKRLWPASMLWRMASTKATCDGV
jgi:hypothetical protein